MVPPIQEYPLSPVDNLGENGQNRVVSILAHFVADVQLLTSAREPGLSVIHLPDGTTTLIFRLLDDAHADLSVVGPRTHALYKRTGAARAVLRIVFQPGGAYPFFGVRVEELADRLVPLRDLWGESADSLLEKLVHARSNAQRLAEMNTTLADKLHGPGVFEPSGVAAVKAALVQLAAQTATIHEVAGNLNMSERNLRRAFSAVVGLSPKRYARIMRFQRALARARLGKPSWSEIAVGSGYFDQAHMCADFRELAHASPGDLCARRSSKHSLSLVHL